MKRHAAGSQPARNRLQVPSKRLAVLAVATALALLPTGAAPASAEWVDGPVAYGYGPNCATDEQEQQLLAYVGYEAPGADRAPVAGATYYVNVVLAVDGSPCDDGLVTDVTLVPPRGTSLAVSAAHPVGCWFTEDGEEFFDVTAEPEAACPTTPFSGPSPHTADTGLQLGQRAIPAGTAFGIELPVVSTAALSGHPSGDQWQAVTYTATLDPPRVAATVGAVVTAAPKGNWLVASDGGVFAFDASYSGSAGGRSLNKPIVGMAADPDGTGYWLVASDGGVFAFDAPYSGSTGGIDLRQPIVGMVADPDGTGYWLVASDGGVFAFDAPYSGSTGGMPLNRPIVGMAADPDGTGYWLVASDGGIFAFDAPYTGSTGGMPLNKPIVGMAADGDGKGYWLAASDGGVFAFDAPYAGSAGAMTLNHAVVGMAADPDGTGYWLVGGDGGVFAFDAPYAGSTGGLRLNTPIVGIAADLG